MFDHRDLCRNFLRFLGDMFVYIDKGAFGVQIPIFEKDLQHEDSH